MSSLTEVGIENAQYSLSYRPVAVFVGGTSGIGEGMARAFARRRNGNAHIILVGRNRAAANSVLASFPGPTTTRATGAEPAPVYEFVECDVRLMRNVQRTTDDLVKRLPKINFLVLTVGHMTLQGRDETDEGIDSKLAVHYYGRWKFIDGLMPLLREAKDLGEDAKVMSVLAAGIGGPVDLDDLALKKNFSVSNAGLATPTYNDLMIESLAERHPDMSFIHAWPGLVRTSLFRGQRSDWLLPALYPFTKLLSYLIAVPRDDCGEFMLHALYQAKPGASRTYSRGEDIGDWRKFTSDEARKRLWEHTVVMTTVRGVDSSD